MTQQITPSGSSTVAATRRLGVGFVLSRSFTLSAFALFVDTVRLASDKFDRSGRVLADWQVLASTRHLITSSCGVPGATPQPCRSTSLNSARPSILEPMPCSSSIRPAGTSHRNNITLMFLPPRSPELNPVENIWQFMPDNWLSNRIFWDYDDIVEQCCSAWNWLIDQPWKIMSIGRRHGSPVMINARW